MNLTFKFVDSKILAAAYGKVLSEQATGKVMVSVYAGLFNEQKTLREKVLQAYEELKNKPDLVNMYLQVYNNFQQTHPSLFNHFDTLVHGYAYETVDQQVQKEGYKRGEKYKLGTLQDIKKFIGFSSDFPVNYFYTIDYNGTVSDKTNKLMKQFDVWYLFTYNPTDLTNLISTYLGIDVSKYPKILEDFYNKYLKGKAPSKWKDIVRSMIKEKQQRLYETRLAQEMVKKGLGKRQGNRIVLAQVLQENGQTVAEMSGNISKNQSTQNDQLDIARLAYPPTLPKINASEIDFGQFTNDPNSQAYVKLNDLTNKNTTYYLLDKVYFIVQRVEKGEKMPLSFKTDPSYDVVIYNGSKQYSPATQKLYDMLKKYLLTSSSTGVPLFRESSVKEVPEYILKQATEEIQKNVKDFVQNSNGKFIESVNLKNTVTVDGLQKLPTRTWVIDYSTIKQKPLFAYVIKQLGQKNFLYNGFYPYGKFIYNKDQSDQTIYNLYVIVTYRTLTVPKKLLTWVEYKQGDPIYQQKTVTETVKDANGKKKTITKTVFEIVDYQEIPVMKQEYYDPLTQKAVAYKDRKGRTYYRIVNRTVDEIKTLNLSDIEGTLSQEQFLGVIYLQFSGAPGNGEAEFKPFITTPNNY